MSLVAAPIGLVAAAHPSGDVRQAVFVDGILSGYGTALYQGSPVQWGTDGTLKAVAAVNDPVFGVFAGCEYTDAVSQRRVISAFWPAGATFIPGSCLAKMVPMDQVAFLIGQTAATVGVTARGQGVNIGSAPAGSIYTGLSSQALGAPTGVTPASFTIYDIVQQPDNAWGDPFVWVYVTVQNKQGPVA